MTPESPGNPIEVRRLKTEIGTVLTILSGSEYANKCEAMPALKTRLEELRRQFKILAESTNLVDLEELSSQVARLSEQFTDSDSNESNKK